jgi:hypothetical protein
MKPEWQPRTISPEEQAFLDRLRARGIVVTPSTVPPGHPLPQPIDLEGVSLSDTVLEEREEQP